MIIGGLTVVAAAAAAAAGDNSPSPLITIMPAITIPLWTPFGGGGGGGGVLLG